MLLHVSRHTLLWVLLLSSLGGPVASKAKYKLTYMHSWRCCVTSRGSFASLVKAAGLNTRIYCTEWGLSAGGCAASIALQNKLEY